MTGGTVGLRFRWIVKAARPDAGNTTQQVGIVMVLAAQEFLVVVQLDRDADLVANRAELCHAVERLEESLLVKIGLGLDGLVVQPLQQGVVTGGERIVLRLFDGVCSVADRAVDVGHSMADGAGDAGAGGRMVDIVKIRIVEGSAEERHGIMTAGTPAGGAHIAVALQAHLPGLAHAEQVGRIIERAEVMRGVEPVVIDIGVAFQAITVHHQDRSRDKIARGRVHRRRFVILLALRGPLGVPFPRVLTVHDTHDDCKGSDSHTPAGSPIPLDLGTRAAVQHVEGHRNYRRNQVQNIDDGAGQGACRQLRQLLQLNESEARQRRDATDRKQGDAQAHRQAVGPAAGGSQVREAEEQEWNHDQDAEHHMGDEHGKREPVGISLDAILLE